MSVMQLTEFFINLLLHKYVGTENMLCDCSSSTYCYEPVGHVITGDLHIIRDAKLRS